jgi:hypothetical protein
MKLDMMGVEGFLNCETQIGSANGHKRVGEPLEKQHYSAAKTTNGRKEAAMIEDQAVCARYRFMMCGC